MDPYQLPRRALELQQAARTSAAALPSRTLLRDGGVAFFGRSGLDSTGTGLLATLVMGLALAASLLAVYERVSRASRARSRGRAHELLAPRLYQTPTEAARPPPLPVSRLAWIFHPLAKLSNIIPRYPSPTDTTPIFLADSQLLVRSLLLLALVAAFYSLPALLIALPIFTANVISTTRYTSGNAILPGLRINETIFGGFSSLDNLSIVRLLHAQRLKDARVPGVVGGAGGNMRFAILVVFGVAIPSLAVAWIFRTELTKARQHQLAAGESEEGGSGCEMAFLPARGPGMEGMSETRLKELLGACGLGSSGVGNRSGGGAAAEELGMKEISVDEVFAVQDLSALASLQTRREKVINELEVAECEYMACFEPSTPPEQEVAVRGSMSTRSSHESSKPRRTASKRRSKKEDSSRPKSSISPFAPLGHFTITPRPATAAASLPTLDVTPLSPPRRPSHALSDSIGRHVTGASFTEVGLVDRPDEFELGQKLRINEQGRWSKALPTPGPLQTTFGFGDDADCASSTSSESPPSSPLSEKPKNRRSSTDNSHRSSYISFPPPRSSSFGVLAGLATLPEGNEEPLSEGEMSEKTTKKRNSSVPDMDDIPSIASDSDEEHYRSSRLQQATRVEFPTPPGVPSIVVRKPSTASSKRLSLPGWRRKKAPPPVLSISPSDSRAPTPSPLPEDPLLRSHPLVPAPALEGVRYLSHTFQFSADPSITTPPSIPNASAAAPRFAPRLHTTSTVSSLELAQLYATLRAKRSELRRKNAEIAELQTVAIAEIAEGKGRVTGFVLVGRRVGMLTGAEKIEGKTKEDLRWELLYQGGRRGGELRFWARVGALAVLMCILAVIPTALAVADAPALASMWVFMRPLLRHGTLPAGLATVVLPTVLLLLLHTLMVISVDYLSCSASISIARSRSLALRASLALSLLLVLFIVTFGAVTSAPASLRQGFHVVRSLADGAVATAPLLLSTSALAALVFPLWSLVRPLETASSKRQLTTAKTPRQRFLALKPAFLSPSAVLALPFFSLSGLVLVAILSPLSALPLVPFLILAALVARHNGLYRSLHSQEMHGTYLITLVTAASFLLPLQPLLLGLMLLAYRYFGQGAACLALSLLIALYLPFEQLRRARSGRVSKATQAALSTFQLNLRHGTTPLVREAGGGASHAQAPSRASALPPPRRSMASIFDLLDSRGFSSVPLSQSSRPSLPLPEPDVLDTFADAELASRLHPDAPPRLALRSAAGRDEVEGVEGRRTMYPPALVGERPTLWLPRDELAEEQAKELRGLYGMKVVWENSVELRRLEGVF